MLDLFEQEEQESSTKVCFSERELDFVVDAIFCEGELLKELGISLQKLRDLKQSTQITPIRKQAWDEFVWVFDLGEPALVTFDMACDVCGADAQGLRAAIGRAFRNEILLMYEFLCARLPDRASCLKRRLCEYVKLKTN